MRYNLLLLFAGLVLVFPVSCSKLSRNLDDDVLAAERYKKKAEKGDVEAQYTELGRYYAEGIGVEENQTEAANWFRAAAERGHLGAQNLLANALAEGAGVERNLDEAIEWFQESARQGEMAAAFNLAVLYYEEEELGPDYVKAMQWFRTAAAGGDTDAVFWIGVLYEEGQGVVQSDEEAYTWHLRAAEEGHELAQYSIGSWYEEGRGVEQSYREAIKWYRMAVGGDDPSIEAQNDLAWIYATCEEAELRSPRKAARYALMAAREEPDNWSFTDTLAAAYASNGWFEDAVAAQEKAIALMEADAELSEEEKEEEREGLMERLVRYESGEPYISQPAEEETGGEGEKE